MNNHYGLRRKRTIVTPPDVRQRQCDFLFLLEPYDRDACALEWKSMTKALSPSCTIYGHLPIKITNALENMMSDDRLGVIRLPKDFQCSFDDFSRNVRVSFTSRPPISAKLKASLGWNHKGLTKTI